MALSIGKSMAIAIGLLVAAQAHADTASFGTWTNGYGVAEFQLPYASSAPTDQNKLVGAGGINTVFGGASFTSYCVDLYQELSLNTQYSNYHEVSGAAHSFVNSSAATDIGRLFTAFGTNLNSAVDQAGFQIALWEISYETSGAYDVTAGAAIFKGSDGAALTRASFYLSNLAAQSNVNVWVLESGTNQDMVHVTPVPEPSTYALMLAGLGAVGFVSRRRRPKA
jgi:hypothetical protein